MMRPVFIMWMSSARSSISAARVRWLKLKCCRTPRRTSSTPPRGLRLDPAAGGVGDGAAGLAPGSILAEEGSYMTQTQPTIKAGAKAYTLEGTLIEACSCRTLCRCWIGEDPDGGACDSFLAYHIDKGEINGVDVSGLNYVGVFKIPGNVLTPHSWKRVTYVD